MKHTLERQAHALANSPYCLKRRLLDARLCLRSQLRREFGAGHFDFDGQRLVGRGGLVLQWRLRRWSMSPISPRNQQTNRGSVALIMEIPDVA